MTDTIKLAQVDESEAAQRQFAAEIEALKYELTATRTERDGATTSLANAVGELHWARDTARQTAAQHQV